MDNNEIQDAPEFKHYVQAVVILGTLTASAVFGTYQIGKLGVDWAKEIRENRKFKKTQK